MPPMFSIITPSYNPGAKLADSFASVLGQASGLVDYWIIDGASSDGTCEWLASHSEAGFRWISEKDYGVYDAMNKAIDLARGRFLLFLGAGDCLMARSLQHVAEFIQQSPSPQPRLIYGDVRYRKTGQPLTTGHYSKMRLCRENICHQGIFYERSIFDRLGRHELRYPVMADWAFNLRCFGDPQIKKLHFPGIVAEFEGGGLCEYTPDIPFMQDRLRLITQRIGVFHALWFCLEKTIKLRLNKQVKMQAVRSEDGIL